MKFFMVEIEIGIAEIAVTAKEDTIVAKSLGSCVGLALYDPIARVGAMAHIMLPDSTNIERKKIMINNPAKFADTAVNAMVKKMILRGAVKDRIVAKMVGGAKMFSTSTSNNSVMNVGSRIVDSTRNALRNEGIPLVAKDVGKDYGRTAIFDTRDGRIKINVLGKTVKII